jgi:hypothetical protein
MKNFLRIFIAISSLFISSAFAGDPEFLVQIKDHKFEPSSIKVPANQKFKLVVENLDKTLEEFESGDLKKEKLVGGEKKVTIPVGPLKSGEYNFFGELQQKNGARCFNR